MSLCDALISNRCYESAWKSEQINLELTETAANKAQDIVVANICELQKHEFVEFIKSHHP